MDVQKSIISVKRNEFKYLLTFDEALRLKEQISAVLSPDEYSLDGPYRVKSLYFDSINNVDFLTKHAGDNIRKKIRLRIYGEDLPTAKLELKSKEGIYQNKSSVTVSKETAKQLVRGNYGVLLDYKSEEAIKIYSMLVLGCYKPAVIVEYDRMAYAYSEYKTRITFDTAVKSSELDLDLYKKDLPYSPVIFDRAILEVKYNEKLPGFLSEILKRYSINNVSVSKYCQGRHFFQNYIA
ncbi:MAG: polyphosphate polymerase domain-containing protein [Clostridiales bacterium]|nr:polyphosphate polymerase domain-containing protein [Clostridiales bacterium]